MSERILELALKTLRACEGSDSVVAGRRHFAQYWLRDACFAHWGHLALSEHDVVERALTLFTSGVNGGHLPLRYGSWSMFVALSRDVLSGFTAYRDKDPVLIARYQDDKGWAEVIDSTPLLVILAGLCALSGGRTIDYEALHRAMDTIAKRERFGLLSQRPYADWCDSVKRRGYVTYTNALYYAALRVMSLLAPDDRRDSYAQKAVEVRALINERLWIRSHYAEYYEDERFDQFSVESNFLCVLFGIADERQTRLIFASFDRHPELLEYIGRRVAQRYPPSEVSLRLRLVGMRDYHDRMQWIWTTGLVLLADRQCNGSSRTPAIIERLERLLEGSEWVSEVYADNKPFKTLLYKSEEPFAWSAGMLIAGLTENRDLDAAFAKIRGV
ncbi:MAG: hypothetical protein ACMXYM_01725 [Candidatus Woesearchaeota archaeon]